MSDTYYQSNYTGQQIDNAIGRIINGELDKLAAGASNAAEAAQSILDGVNEAIASIPTGSTPIINDLTTGGQSMALSAEMGKILGHRPNRNLLDNWYFADPINQRGITDDVVVNSYFIDRWQLMNAGSVTFGDGYITITADQGWPALLRQIWEESLVFPVTFSVLTTNGLLSVTLTEAGGATFDGGIQLVVAPENNCYVFFPQNSSLSIVAVKLELGSVQTLAHQDASGKWVLNDPPPNKGLELLKCVQSKADGDNDGCSDKIVFHSGNKPIGGYTGNGSPEQREIAIGCVGKTLLIGSSSEEYLCFVNDCGGFIIGNDFVRTECEALFADGVLTLATDAEGLNTYQVEYYYQVL